MSNADFLTALANLQEALEEYEHAWKVTRESWNDSSSANFEEWHVRPVRPKIMAAVDAVQRLSDVMQRAQRECEWQRETF